MTLRGESSGPSRSAGGVSTDPGAAKPHLRGRTYAIPFDRVWTVALLLAAERMPRWSVYSWNDRNGTIQANASGRFSKVPDDVRIVVTLDAYGQTRLDMSVQSRKGTRSAAKRITEFLTALDEALELKPGEVLDPRYAERHPE